jgi:hypothetical protein
VTSVLVIVVYYASLTEVIVVERLMVQLRESGTFLILQEIKSQFEEAVIVETFFIEIEILELYV